MSASCPASENRLLLFHSEILGRKVFCWLLSCYEKDPVNTPLRQGGGGGTYNDSLLSRILAAALMRPPPCLWLPLWNDCTICQCYTHAPFFCPVA